MTEIFDDIRKLYHFNNPCEELSPFIEFFSQSSKEATRQHSVGNTFTIKMFRSWTPTFWINLGPSYKVRLDNKTFAIPSGSGIAVARDGLTERINAPNDHLFSVKFYPGGLESLLGIDQSRMAGKALSLKQLLPSNLLVKVKDASNYSERIQLMQDYLLAAKKACKRDHYLQLVTQTIATYTNNGLKYNVSETAAKNFISSKTINRYFQKIIGVTPKIYFETVRARTTLISYINDTQFDPSAFGYYDKSHFYKSINKFTGSTIR